MKTLHFSVRINARRARVWDCMLNQDGYRHWTAAFHPGSYYAGSWNQGERIRFLGPGGQGGMTAVIAENRLHEFISIHHLGEVVNGVDVVGDKASTWANAYENYTFTSDGEATLLKIDVDTVPEFESFMNEAWPRALSSLKELCESGK